MDNDWFVAVVTATMLSSAIFIIYCASFLIFKGARVFSIDILREYISISAEVFIYAVFIGRAVMFVDQKLGF